MLNHKTYHKKGFHQFFFTAFSFMHILIFGCMLQFICLRKRGS